ncbi:hypothetical protein [Endozoicomonas sp. ALC066]|uniref:hypothetical protein n=1 Tax=Endozoicomonas sp. ALC066 TaxID=3403078 RepID=UPI003BB65094
MSNLKTKKARKRAERAESIRLEFMKSCISELGESAKNPADFVKFGEIPAVPAFSKAPKLARKAKAVCSKQVESVRAIAQASRDVEFLPTESPDTLKKLHTGKIRKHYVPDFDPKVENHYDRMKSEKSVKNGTDRDTPQYRLKDGELVPYSIEDIGQDNPVLQEPKSRPASYKSGKVKSYVGEMPTKRERAEQAAYFGLTDKPKTAKTDALLVARAAEPRHLQPLPEVLPTVDSDVRPAKAKLGSRMEYMGTTYVLAMRNNRLGWVRLLTDSQGNKFSGRQIELPYEQNDL